MSTTKQPAVKVHIRWLIRRDFPGVLQVEAENSHQPWTEEDFLRALRQRSIIGMVAEVGDDILGFMVYELHKARLQLLNFAVSPKHRRRTVGAQMIAKLAGKLNAHRRTCITAEVRETNLDAQVFFRSQGFKAVRVLRRYYQDTGEDAIVMRYSIAGDAEEDAVETSEGTGEPYEVA